MTKLDLSMLKEPVNVIPKVVDVDPIGSQVLVELLTQQELVSTTILVPGETDTGIVPQAYVLKLGPNFPKDVDLHVGDRVMVQGKGVPVPNFDESVRQKMLVEYPTIKAVLKENH